MWHSWNWWWIMPLTMLAVLSALLFVVFAVSHNRGPWPPGLDPVADAERILDERYARGEIDDHEFRHRLAVLRGNQAESSGSS